MLKLTDINLIRTTSYYQSDTFKGWLSNAVLAPVKAVTSAKSTEFFLKNVTLHIGDNERIAVLGKNGSGKSTLCRLIASQLFQSSGQITNTFQTRLFSQLESSFFAELSGRENLKYFITFIYNDLSKPEKKLLLQGACDFSELGAALDRQVETYSSGMISRLALSLILAKKHDFLLLDEIHSHMDIAFRKKVSERLKNVIDSSNSVLIVSHHLDEIVGVCNRGIIIDGGRIIFDGPIQAAMSCYRVMVGEIHA